jgi:hypothetical protein
MFGQLALPYTSCMVARSSEEGRPLPEPVTSTWLVSRTVRGFHLHEVEYSHAARVKLRRDGVKCNTKRITP